MYWRTGKPKPAEFARTGETHIHLGSFPVEWQALKRRTGIVPVAPECYEGDLSQTLRKGICFLEISSCRMAMSRTRTSNKQRAGGASVVASRPRQPTALAGEFTSIPLPFIPLPHSVHANGCSPRPLHFAAAVWRPAFYSPSTKN